MWRTARTALSVALVACLVGCATGGTEDPRTPPEDATVVVGTGTCTLESLGDEIVDGVRVVTERFTCHDEMSDARVTGTETLAVTTRLSSSLGGTWSTAEAVLTTEGGTWRGWAQGVVDLSGVLPFAEGVTPFNYGEGHYLGEGAYKGLEYHYYMSGSNEEAGVTGWIVHR
jgi:hypothetical protein